MNAVRMAIAGLLCACVSSADADKHDTLDWLCYDAGLTQFYDFDLHPTDPARHRVVQSWADADAESKRILLLIPKRSDIAYSISVNTLLRVFHERRLPVDAEIWNYATDEASAAEALVWADTEAIDMILSVGSVATQYLHTHYAGAGNIPVVTSASKDPKLMGQMPDYESGSGTNVAYTSISVPIETLLAYMRELLPGLANLGVIYAQKNTSAVKTQLEPLRELAQREKDLNVFEVGVRNQRHAREDLQARIPSVLAQMKEQDPYLRNSAFLVTGSTSVYDEIGLINQLTENAPVIATLPDVVRPGEDSALLSIGINQSSAVQLAARYAIDILSGNVEPGALKVGVVSPPDIAVSFLKAKKIGLRIPFSFLESATFVYDHQGRPVRLNGQRAEGNGATNPQEPASSDCAGYRPALDGAISQAGQ